MPDYALSDDDKQAVEQRTQAQHPFLQRLAKDIVASAAVDVAESMGGRLALYGRSAQAPYEQGYGSAMTSTLEDGQSLQITWRAMAGDPCDLCEARDGTVYDSIADLPGYPGDGGFGDLCEGGPNCRCVLEYAIAGAVEAA